MISTFQRQILRQLDSAGRAITLSGHPGAKRRAKNTRKLLRRGLVSQDRDRKFAISRRGRTILGATAE